MKIFTVALFTLALSLLRIPAGFAQTPAATEIHCSLVPVLPAERAQKAALVVEGEVLDARGFWDAAHRHIYTAHRVRVFKTFKGASAAELTVLTEGGAVGLDRQESTNTLRLLPGEQGILYLYQAPFSQEFTAGAAWAAYGSEQGFIRYDLATGSAAEPFRQYPLIGADFYAQLSAATGQPLREVQPNPVLSAALVRLAQPPVAQRGAAPLISGLSPLTISAGTGSVLTISGSGFGTTRGAGFVEFKNADDGGATFVRPQDGDYVSWTDTQIRVVVPSYSAAAKPAGTGPVRVTTNEAVAATSAASLTVVFALTNVQEDQSKLLYRAGHINQNTTGGYTFHFDPGFAANTPAAGAWQRALASWRCQTGINWEVGTTRTKTGVADDGENAVGFDNGAELPTGVLGRTTSYYSGCRNADNRVVFWVREIDMQFDDARSWQFGPALSTRPQFDFESVAVHELGHAQQLAHLILPTAIMHYAIAAGTNSRALNAASDIAGGRLVLRTRSFAAPTCNPAAMLPAPLTSVAANSLGATGVELTWATRDECFLQTGQAFVVERSADTTAWQAVTTLAAGATTNTYRYVDATPLRGLSYYRLRLRRPDGTLDNVAPLAVTDDALAASGVEFYPNPLTTGPLRLLYTGTEAGTLTLLVYDGLGRYCAGYALTYHTGLNQLSQVVDSLRPGWYIVRWRDTADRTGTARLVKIN